MSYNVALELSRALRKAEARIKALEEQVDTLSAERNRLLQQTAVAIERAETAENALLEVQEHHDMMGDDHA